MGILGCVPLERAGVRRVLEEDAWIRVVGEGSAGQSSRLVRTVRPDLLVTLHDGPDDALGDLGPTAPSLPRIVLVSRLSERAARVLLRHGANGILLRDDSLDHLRWAVRAAAAGGLALSPTAAAFVTEQFARPDRLTEETVAARKLVNALSPREQEILRFLEKGLSNSHMADALTISGHTVKDHVRAVYAKLGVDNRVQAARIAWQADGGRSTGARVRAGHIGTVTGAVTGTVRGTGIGFRPSGALIPHPL
ncbi:response regulator transcription factor [Streptomyces europaeiscabiei]|uniref:response regulator transcription factor n=1 Tax=Streptomyces europaeiscabiei TaxID=146819 RepID=UPI0029AEFFF9|nr:response regulator transcription factor [Streptomyces europaeiscabiei]MDX3619437.1 response regulator transcription factor [Streptomyces europaeiscabiei]